jgi:hypothetical protein
MRRYRTGAHAKYDLKAYIVWVPKYRKRILTGPVAVRITDEMINEYINEQGGEPVGKVDFKSTPLEPLALKARVVQCAECAAIRLEVNPHVHLGALSSLVALLRRATSDGDNACVVPSNAAIADVARNSDDSNRGDSNATSLRSSPGRSKHRETIRSLRPSGQRQPRPGTAAGADTSRADARSESDPICAPIHFASGPAPLREQFTTIRDAGSPCGARLVADRNN